MAVDRKSVPQGLKAEEVGRWMSALKPGPTRREKQGWFQSIDVRPKGRTLQRISFPRCELMQRIEVGSVTVTVAGHRHGRLLIG